MTAEIWTQNGNHFALFRASGILKGVSVNVTYRLKILGAWALGPVLLLNCCMTLGKSLLPRRLGLPVRPAVRDDHVIRGSPSFGSQGKGLYSHICFSAAELAFPFGNLSASHTSSTSFLANCNLPEPPLFTACCPLPTPPSFLVASLPEVGEEPWAGGRGSL